MFLSKIQLEMLHSVASLNHMDIDDEIEVYKKGNEDKATLYLIRRPSLKYIGFSWDKAGKFWKPSKTDK